MGVDTADTEYTWKETDYVVLHFLWKSQSVGISLRIGRGLKCPTSKAKHRDGRKCIKEWMELDLNSAKREDKKDVGQMAGIAKSVMMMVTHKLNCVISYIRVRKL